MMLLGAASAPAATGAAPIWVAAIGALSLIAGALIPEMFKLLKPRPGEAPIVVPPAVTAEAFQDLTRQVQELAVRHGTLKGELGSMRHEVRRTRETMETRDREHLLGLERVRDEVQEHRWREHSRPPVLPGPRSSPELPAVT